MIKALIDHRSGVAVALLLLLAACSTTRERGEPVPGSSAAVGRYKVGQPYQINGKWYYPEYDPSYDRVGTASWYGDDFQGLPTANGEVFDKERITAAHPTLPLPSLVRVTNLENGRSADLRVNDRGPFVGDRLIDLSQAAARQLGYEGRGLAKVRVTFLGLADATGTPPRPTVTRLAKAAPKPAPLPVAVAERAEPRESALPVTVLAGQPVQVAALASTAPAAAACSGGPQYVQVGAFADTTRVRAALDVVGGLEKVRVEPTFVAGKAMARVRLGPVTGGIAAARLLEEVRALGYTSAFLAPATKTGAPTTITC
jgi:rare lipoprotein A